MAHEGHFGSDPLDYSKGVSSSQRPVAEVENMHDSSVYPGSQGGGKATGHKGHKMHTEHGNHNHGHHPSPKSLGHHSKHGAKGKY